MLGFEHEVGTPTLGVAMPFTEAKTSFWPKASEGCGPEEPLGAPVPVPVPLYAELGVEDIDSDPYIPFDVKYFAKTLTPYATINKTTSAPIP